MDILIRRTGEVATTHLTCSAQCIPPYSGFPLFTRRPPTAKPGLAVSFGSPWSGERMFGRARMDSLRSDQLNGVRFAAGCWVQRGPRRAPDALALFVYDVFWLLSFGF